MISLEVNGKRHDVDVSPDMPLLWVIRDHLGITGTKYGCGISQCGSCTVHIDGQPKRSCRTLIKNVQGTKITTIEGIPEDHPVIQAWINDDVPQCGYCHPGQVMSAVALLNENPKPSDEEIDRAMSGNLCRCGTYQRIRRAIHRASIMLSQGGK